MFGNIQKRNFFKLIPTSQTGIKQTFGKYSGLLNPGIHFYVPFFQKITKISNRIRENSFRFEIKTRDDVFAVIDLSVQFCIEPDDSDKAFFKLNNPHEQINSYIENIIRSETPRMTLNEIYESQDHLSQSIDNNLSPKMKEFGYTIVKTLVRNIEPNKEVKKAMNAIYASERLKKAAENEAEANYIKKVREAEADRDRKRLQGEGMSQQRLAILTGYKEGVDQMSQHLGLTPREIIEFVMKTQHLDAIESIGNSPNTKTIFVNHDPNKANFMEAKEVI